MLDAIDALAALIMTPSGIASIGLATAAVIFVRRAGNKPKRTD
ncbi:hypothetical protein [Sandaracinobacter neustonicus]|nr:hypothetical protein [Sandaracinobacter neustonicus]